MPIEELEAALRSLGLFVDSTEEVPGERPTILVRAYIGDLAFLSRVQDPAQSSVDLAFAEIVRAERQKDWQETRQALGSEFRDL